MPIYFHSRWVAWHMAETLARETSKPAYVNDGALGWYLASEASDETEDSVSPDGDWTVSGRPADAPESLECLREYDIWTELDSGEVETASAQNLQSGG